MDRAIAETSARLDIAALATCPLPKSSYEHILLGHGSGGSLSAELIKNIFVPGFDNDTLTRLEDSATLAFPIANRQSQIENRIAITTDSFVVKPIFFPGGDIGTLAVHGTVNDLAVGGAEPLYLSAAFILEEGLALSDLKKIVASMRRACDAAGVTLVCGDTKVVDRGKGDQIFITTTGVGRVLAGRCLSIANARPGDRIIVSGTVGDHGIAIMSVREGIEFETPLLSDTAALNGLTKLMLDACPSIRLMRDPTRGGVSSTLNELAEASRVGVRLDQSKLPLRDEVKGACEMLGLDPLYVANEGKLIAVVPRDHAPSLLAQMQQHPLGKNAAIIGEVTNDHPGIVVQKSLVGGERVVTMIAGEQLPRIC